MARRTKSLAVFCLMLFAARGTASARQFESFPPSEVRLLDGPFFHAQRKDREYLLAMDPDRLLAPYLSEAGLAPKAEPYGNWESSGLAGHIGGHYLSALSFMAASTGDSVISGRLHYMLTELHRAQEANGDGYLGGVPGGRALWREIAAGRIEAEPFSLDGKWVPWYNLHKIYAGLRDAYLVAGIQEARDMLVDLADWASRLTAGLSDAQIQTMLRTEQGGMNEVLADVASITGDPGYLALAGRFSDRTLLEPLLRGEDRLTGLHANTQIPKVIGFARIAHVAADLGIAGYEDWGTAARFFWETVVGRRTVAIGGNSVGEHFNPADDFESMVTAREGPETCNTYNMLRLTKMLYGSEGSGRYVDYTERALYNHILSSQNPDTGGLVYFTPMRPGHYRVYSQPEEAMWCCVGSGMESQAKYGTFIYAHAGDDLYVNLFVASTLDWKERGIRIIQDTRFPDSERSTIRVDGSGSFALGLRRPAWVRAGAMTVALNGKDVPVGAATDGFVRIERTWRPGDEISVTVPMHTTLEQMPDGSEFYAVLRGPIVLAARVAPFEDEHLSFVADDSRFGHIPDGPTCPPEATPVLVGDPEAFAAGMVPVAGESLTYRAPDLIRGPDHELTLIPFFRLHDSRYVVYWPREGAAPADGR